MPPARGNLVRVHEELVAEGADLSYPALTAFCRRHGIGQKPKLPAGQYHFEPGEECSTTRHRTRRARRQAAHRADGLGGSMLLAHAIFPVLPDLPAFRLQSVSDRRPPLLRRDGRRVMIDNTHVVVLRGTGRRWFRCRRWLPSPNASASSSSHTRSVTPIDPAGSSGPFTSSSITFWPAGRLPTGTI